jgi:drug/metabolite transporter (DMT)-like permease
LRFAIGATLLLWLQWWFEGFRVLRPMLPQLIVLGLIGNVAYQPLFIYGLAQTEASQASMFVATTPLWILVLARFTGHDKFSGRVIAGVVVGLVGVILLLWESVNGVGSEERFWIGNLLLLGATVSWAIYTVYSQPLLLKLRPLALTSATMAAGGLPLVLVGLPEIVSIRVNEVSFASWLGLLYSALLALVFGYFFWAHAIQTIGSTRTSLYVNLVPVVATVSAWVWLDERLSPLQLLGAIAVITGITLSRRLNLRSAE